MKTRWKIIAALVGVVVLSALAGGVAGSRIAAARIRAKNNPERWNVSVMHQLQRRPEQAARIQAHLDSRVEELKTLREDTLARTDVIIGQLIDDVDRELTPEQKEEF